MLKLLTFAPGLGVRSPSPFAVKAEALLAMSGLDFEKEYGTPQNSPTGKFPVLMNGETKIPDSGHIQKFLEENRGAKFDDHLTAQQMAIATAFRRLIEHHMYFLNAEFRWNDHPQMIKETYFASVPALIRGFVFSMVKKNLMKTLHLQGLGRHSRREKEAFLAQDIEAISIQLGNKPYFLGDEPSSIDASLFGAMHNMIDCELSSPGKNACMKHDNLIAYTNRFKEEFFND